MKATEHKESGEKMHVYEVGYLIMPTVSEDKVAEEVSSIRTLIEQSGGAIISEEFPKMRELAYAITKVAESKKYNYDEAYFGWIKFEILVSELAKIEAALKVAKNILRYLIMKTIRENTMFSENLPSATAEKRLDEISPKAGQSIQGVLPEEKKIVSQDEIDKSIDALVIS